MVGHLEAEENRPITRAGYSGQIKNKLLRNRESTPRRRRPWLSYDDYTEAEGNSLSSLVQEPWSRRATR